MRSKQWLNEGPPRLFESQTGAGGSRQIRSNSLSGNERNRLMLQRNGDFEEVSLVSGTDFKQDGRGFVLFDYDNDGWLDIGLISPNAPRFRILRNQIGDLIAEDSQPRKRVEVELFGGNTTSEPSTQWSARDGYGAKIMATFGQTKRAFVYACSEGLSSQNSRRLHIGMGQNSVIDELRISWPSGKTSKLENIQAGESLKIYENKSAGESVKQ